MNPLDKQIIKLNKQMSNTQPSPTQALKEPQNCKIFSQTTSIAQDAVWHLIESFKQQLKINKMLEHIPVVESNFVSTLNGYCIEKYYFDGQQTTKTDRLIPYQEQQPIRAQMDNISTFNVKLQQHNSEIIPSIPKQMTNNGQNASFIVQNKSQKSSLNYSMSKSYQKSKQMMQNEHFPEGMNSEQYVNKADELRKTVKSFELQKQQSEQLSSSGEIEAQLRKSVQPIPLKAMQDRIDTEQKVLDEQIQGMKKHLYTLRRYRKQNIEDERLRIEEKMKKHNVPGFKKSAIHTYEYDGKYIQMTSKNLNTSATYVNQIGRNTSNEYDYPQNQKRPILLKQKLMKKSLHKAKNINDDVSVENSLRNSIAIENPQKSHHHRENSTELQTEKKIYGNGNQRQVSHLPFIRLKQNAKLSQGRRQLAGSESMPESFRGSINRSKMSIDSNGSQFKSHTQLDLERRLEDTRKRSINELMSSPDDVSQTNVQLVGPTVNMRVNRRSPAIKRQSKMMQKYLQKLGEQKNLIKQYQDIQNKSINFQHNLQLNTSQKHPLHRYYQHNYDEERQSGEGSLIRKKNSSMMSRMTNDKSLG